MAAQPLNYLTARGFLDVAPIDLNEALRVILDNMEPTIYGHVRDIPAKEQAILKASGFVLESIAKSDALADTAVKYAAIVKRSLSSKAASERLRLSPSRVRQMIAERSLYSFLIGRDRYIPDFQFERDRLVANIEPVNKSLRPDLHPVEAYNWYHLPHVDLFLNDDIDQTTSPLDWLKSGQNVEQVIFLAARL